MYRFDAEIKTYKDGKRSEFIILIIYHVRTKANVAAMCAIVTIMIAKYTFQPKTCERYWKGIILVPAPMTRWQHIE